MLGWGGAAALLFGAVAIVGVFGWWSSPPMTGGDETEDLIARMSHELRTPLTSVLGLLDLLHGDDASIGDEERSELLGLARTEVLWMNW